MAIRFACGVVFACLAVAACKGPYDFNRDGTADFAWVDTSTGEYWRVGEPEPFWTPVASAGAPEFWPAPGAFGERSVWDPGVLSALGWESEYSGLYDAFPEGVPYSHPVAGDYTGDGTMERALWDPGTSTWHIEGQEPVTFGAVYEGDCHVFGDLPTPGDFNGDGVTTLAVFRPTDQRFHFADGTMSDPFPMGAPVVADYDGDGTDDLAVYEPHTATWHFADGSSVAGATTVIGPIPAPADYNGDGAADLVVFDYHTGRWIDADDTVLAEDSRAIGAYSTTTSPGLVWDALRILFVAQLVVDDEFDDYYSDCRPPAPAELAFMDPQTGAYYQVGEEDPYWVPANHPTFDEYIAVPADYTGDGVREPATFGPDGWESRDVGLMAGPIGTHHVPGDYTGDGKANPATYGYWDGTWIIEGLGTIAFGIGEDQTCDWARDVPTPGDFDGDGVTQLAVYRPTDQRFHFADGTFSGQFPAGLPTVADFSGDGRDQVAVLTLSDDPVMPHVWHFDDGTTLALDIAPGQYIVPLPVPADYTGDGRADPVVFDYETGRWLLPDAVLAEDPRAQEAQPTRLNSTAAIWDMLALTYAAVLYEDGDLESELANC
jgi:hypothetical protein